MSANDRARVAVSRIVGDLSDRKGLGDEWDKIDNQTRKEIVNTWRTIIALAFSVKADV
jgi:hypothetical protein